MHTILQKFKSLDGFGEQVTVNYRGENTYQTVPGAVLTLMTFMLVTAYSGFQITQLKTMSNPDINVFDRSIDASDTQSFKFDENKMEIYFSAGATKRPYNLNFNNPLSSFE